MQYPMKQHTMNPTLTSPLLVETGTDEETSAADPDGDEPRSRLSSSKINSLFATRRPPARHTHHRCRVRPLLLNDNACTAAAKKAKSQIREAAA